jgi:hypothetical protein
MSGAFKNTIKSVYDGNEKQVSGCLFLVVLVLSYIQTISSLNDKTGNKTLPIITLITTILVTIGILGNVFGGAIFKGLEKYFFVIFLVMLGISMTLAIQDVSKPGDEDKSVPIVTLVIETILLLLMGYTFVTNNLM